MGATAAISQSSTATTSLSRNIMLPMRPSPHDSASGLASSGRLSVSQAKQSSRSCDRLSPTTHSR